MANTEALSELVQPAAPVSARIGKAVGINAKWRGAKVSAALAFADAASAGLVVWLAGASVDAITGEPIHGLPGYAIAAAALIVCLHQLLGLYEGCRSNPVELFRDRVQAAAIFTTCIAIAFGAQRGDATLLLAWPFLFAALVAVECLADASVRRLLMRWDLWREPVVLVGERSSTERLAIDLDERPQLGFRAVATLASPTGENTVSVSSVSHSVRSALLVSSGDAQADLRTAALLDFPSVIVLRDAGALQSLWLQPRTVGDAVGIEIRRSLLVRRNLRLKRAFDLLLAVPLCLAAAPIIAGCAFAIWWVDGGSPFYAQTRTGYRGRPIRVLKLRSMYRDSDARLAKALAEDGTLRAEWERFFKLSEDPRILPRVGNFIRRSSLDELPQLWNVVRGDMSLVGPRPFPAYHLAGFDTDFCELRTSVIPGLSGLWQITERSDADLPAQKRCDTYYIRNWSIWFDLYILVHTLPAVLFARGAR